MTMDESAPKYESEYARQYWAWVASENAEWAEDHLEPNEPEWSYEWDEES